MFYNKLKQLSILLICLSFSVSGLSNDVLAQGQPTLKSDLIEILRKSGIKYDEGAIEDNSKNVSFTGKRIELPITFEETKSTTDIYKATFDLSVDDDQNRIFTGIFKKIETNFDGGSTSSDRIVLEVLYNQNSGTNSISKATVTIEDIKIDITEQIIIKIKKAESKVTQEVPGQGRHGLSLTNIDVKLIDEGISLTNGDIKISVEKNNFDKSVSPESIPVEIGAYIREILHPENLLTLYYPKPGDMGEIILGVEGSSSEIKLNNMSYNNWRISFQEPKLNVKTFAFNLNTSDIIKNEIQGAFSVSLSDIRGLEGTDYPNEITPKDININIEYFNFPSLFIRDYILHGEADILTLLDGLFDPVSGMNIPNIEIKTSTLDTNKIDFIIDGSLNFDTDMTGNINFNTKDDEDFRDAFLKFDTTRDFQKEISKIFEDSQKNDDLSAFNLIVDTNDTLTLNGIDLLPIFEYW